MGNFRQSPRKFNLLEQSVHLTEKYLTRGRNHVNDTESAVQIVDWRTTQNRAFTFSLPQPIWPSEHFFVRHIRQENMKHQLSYHYEVEAKVNWEDIPKERMKWLWTFVCSISAPQQQCENSIGHGYTFDRQLTSRLSFFLIASFLFCCTLTSGVRIIGNFMRFRTLHKRSMWHLLFSSACPQN